MLVFLMFPDGVGTPQLFHYFFIYGIAVRQYVYLQSTSYLFLLLTLKSMKKYLSFLFIFILGAGFAAVFIKNNFSADFAFATPGVDEPPKFCINKNLPSSTTYKESNWNVNFIGSFTANSYINSQDINGDGLVDFIYHGTGGSRNSCVLLNNGHGWDEVYTCRMQFINGAWIFYGDCADV